MDITFSLPGVGTVMMVGTGPWHVYAHGSHSCEIRDSKKLVANPTVVQPFGKTGMKPNRNVVFARAGVAQLIVETANAKLAERAQS